MRNLNCTIDVTYFSDASGPAPWLLPHLDCGMGSILRLPLTEVMFPKMRNAAIDFQQSLIKGNALDATGKILLCLNEWDEIEISAYAAVGYSWLASCYAKTQSVADRFLVSGQYIRKELSDYYNYVYDVWRDKQTTDETIENLYNRVGKALRNMLFMVYTLTNNNEALANTLMGEYVDTLAEQLAKA